MFEDSLVESTGRIRTRSRHYAAGSLLLQLAILSVLFLIPYLHPARLPKEALALPLVAPPPMSSPAPVVHASAPHAASPVPLAILAAPSIIPKHVAPDSGASPATTQLGPDFNSTGSDTISGAISILGRTPPAPVVRQAKPSSPIRVSVGVASGRLLTPIRPAYPTIARAAHVQGTVIIEAVIARNGMVEQARVVSGSPLLAHAALTAVERARYQPYLLNGEPVEVETTINIIFTLDN